MNRLALLLFLASVSTTLYAQNQPPTLVYEAAHCLVAGNQSWLDAQTLQAPDMNLGFHLDSKTLLGDEYMYLVVYTTPHFRNQGKIFDVRVKQHHTFSIENSASFVSSAKGVDFPEPPVGGQWAQAQFVTAIQEIEHHKLYTASMKSLLKASKHIQCESAVDKSAGDKNDKN
jgi:hypothetical protein